MKTKGTLQSKYLEGLNNVPGYQLMFVIRAIMLNWNKQFLQIDYFQSSGVIHNYEHSHKGWGSKYFEGLNNIPGYQLKFAIIVIMLKEQAVFLNLLCSVIRGYL